MSAAHSQEEDDESVSSLDLTMESTHGSTEDNTQQLITVPTKEQHAPNGPEDQFWSEAVEKLRRNKNIELSITEIQGITEFKVIVKKATYCEEHYASNSRDKSVDKEGGLLSLQPHIFR